MHGCGLIVMINSTFLVVFELGKMAVASSNESLLNATGSGVGIDDSNIASQDSAISNSSTGSFSEPVRKKQRSSRTVTPTYDPQIQVDDNLVDALKRGRLLSTSQGPLPKHPISMHNYELHLSAGERRELELVLLIPELALFYTDGSFTDLDPKGLEPYPVWKAGFAWA